MKKNSVKSSKVFNVFSIEEKSANGATESNNQDTQKILENKWCNRRSLIALILIILLAIGLIVYLVFSSSLAPESHNIKATARRENISSKFDPSRRIVSRYETPRHVYYSNGQAWYRDAPSSEQYNRPRRLSSQLQNYRKQAYCDSYR